MTKRTRLFLSVAAGTLVVGLGAGLVASYFGVQRLALTGGNGPAELSYLPPNTSLLAYADLRAVMDSELHRRFSELRPGVPGGASRFKDQTGIDIEQDIDYIVAASTRSASDTQGSDGPMPESPLVLARGRFDQARIEQLITEQGGVAEDYNESRLLAHAEANLALAFVEPGLVAIGVPAAVRRAIDTKAGGIDVTGNDELMRLVRGTEDADAWAVAEFDALVGDRVPADLAKQLPAISWFSAKGFLNEGLRIELRVDARDEAAAENLREVIRGFVALARLQAGQQAQMTELMNTLELSTDGTTVTLGLKVPIEIFESLGARRPRSPRPPRPPAPPAL